MSSIREEFEKAVDALAAEMGVTAYYDLVWYSDRWPPAKGVKFVRDGKEWLVLEAWGSDPETVEVGTNDRDIEHVGRVWEVLGILSGPGEHPEHCHRVDPQAGVWQTRSRPGDELHLPSGVVIRT